MVYRSAEAYIIDRSLRDASKLDKGTLGKGNGVNEHDMTGHTSSTLCPQCFPRVVASLARHLQADPPTLDPFILSRHQIDAVAALFRRIIVGTCLLLGENLLL